MLTGKYWPVHPKPLPGEIFSSWLIRTAIGNSVNLQTFCHLIWPHRQIWTRDIDRLYALDLLDVMAARTATQRNGLERLFLHSYERILFDQIAQNSVNYWLRYVGIHHRLRKRHGLMYCPLCLESDEIPYFRKIWRTNLSPICHVHATVLRDSCEKCDRPIMPHRGEMLECNQCGYDIRDAKAWASDPGALALGNALIERSNGIRVWGADVPDIDNNIEFFETVRAVMSMLSLGRRSDWLRLYISKFTKQRPKFKPKDPSERQFEYLRANELHDVFTMSALLMRGWPWMMVGLCGEARIWKSWALAGQNRERLPTLTDIGLNFLDGTPPQ